MSEQEQDQAAGETSPRLPPNARYRLSRKNADGEELTFHYSRERRLAKAPQTVRDLYREDPPPRFNLLRPLIGSRPRAMMFGTIMLICVTMLILSIFNITGNTYSLAGNVLSVQARRYEGALVMTVKKTVKKGVFLSGGDVYTGAVDVAVSPALQAAGGEAPPVFFHRIFFSLENVEEYRFSVPFDSGELVVVLQTETHTLNLKIKPEKP
jgi:hypothetical protein